MTHRIRFGRYLWLHTVASFAGGSLLFLGTAGPLLLYARGLENALSTLQLGGLFTVGTILMTFPFTFTFWIVHRNQGRLSRSAAAAIGALVAVVVYVLMIGLSGKAIRFSADFMLFLGVLIGAGIGGGLSFRYLLNSDTKITKARRS